MCVYVCVGRGGGVGCCVGGWVVCACACTYGGMSRCVYVQEFTDRLPNHVRNLHTLKEWSQVVDAGSLLVYTHIM